MPKPTAAEHTAAEVRATLARKLIPQSTLARHLGLSDYAMSRRLRGATPFTLDEIAATAEFLRLPLSTLLPDQRQASA